MTKFVYKSQEDDDEVKSSVRAPCFLILSTLHLIHLLAVFLLSF